MVELICKSCGKAFEVDQWRVDKGAKYCSRNCWNKEMPSLLTGHKYNGQICPKCGKCHTDLGALALKRFTGKKQSIETIKKRQKTYLANKSGLVVSVKLSKALSGRKKSEEHKRKLSLWAVKRLSNPCNHPNWKDGISKLPYSFNFDNKLKEKIKDRDDHICQLCGSTEKLCPHHIDYNKQNSSEDNLITLCLPCNTQCNFNRERWSWYLKNKLFVIRREEDFEDEWVK